MQSINPVSYTHLDVYKRQVYLYLVQVWIGLLPVPQGSYTVSYTHLDVYKRQEWETDILAHMYCRFANHIQLLIIFIYFIIIRALPILALVTDLQFVTQFNIKIKQAFEYIDKFHGYLHAFTNNKLSLLSLIHI